MSKRNRLRKEVEAAKPAEPVDLGPPLKLGEHVIPDFDGIDATFGANLKSYPKYETIPEPFRRGTTKFNDAAGLLFFQGGKLEDYGLRLKPTTNRARFFTAVRALLCSFEPPHELKDATVAWLLSEYSEPVA
jgi:hypothetical protein